MEKAPVKRRWRPKTTQKPLRISSDIYICLAHLGSLAIAFISTLPHHWPSKSIIVIGIASLKLDHGRTTISPNREEWSGTEITSASADRFSLESTGDIADNDYFNSFGCKGHIRSRIEDSVTDKLHYEFLLDYERGTLAIQHLACHQSNAGNTLGPYILRER